MKPLENCPFCQNKMMSESRSGDRTKLFCQGAEDHTFIELVLDDTNEVMDVVCRVGPGDVRYYLTLSYLSNTSRIWAGRFDQPNKIHLNSVVNIDFTKGLEATMKKIKTYLTFS